MSYRVETVTNVNLYLEDTNNVLFTVGNKQIMSRSNIYIGSNGFAYDAVNKYRFGCDSGKFNYKQLLEQIALAQDTGAQVDALLPIKGGKAITTEIVEESDTYYILKTGKALLKANYTKGKTSPTPKEGSFGKFTYKKDYRDDYYYYWGTNRAGDKKADILDAMLKAKAIIDFLEDKGDYAKVDEEVVDMLAV